MSDTAIYFNFVFYGVVLTARMTTVVDNRQWATVVKPMFVTTVFVGQGPSSVATAVLTNWRRTMAYKSQTSYSLDVSNVDCCLQILTARTTRVQEVGTAANSPSSVATAPPSVLTNLTNWRRSSTRATILASLRGSVWRPRPTSARQGFRWNISYRPRSL